jgi:hypothetical protein
MSINLQNQRFMRSDTAVPDGALTPLHETVRNVYA